MLAADFLSVPSGFADHAAMVQDVQRLFQQGLAAQQGGQLDAARALYQQVLALAPQHVHALANLSSLELTARRPDAALACGLRALALAPQEPVLHYTCGLILSQLRRPGEALVCYERAAQLRPAQAQFHASCATALHDLSRYEEALERHDRAIALLATEPEFYSNRGNTLGCLCRVQEAIRDYEMAIALRPDFADAHWNLATLRILNGDLAGGLKEYEWRWQRAFFQAERRKYREPLWLGEQDLTGKTILIYWEQGLGDVIQHVRYVPMLVARGARVILEVQKPLVALMVGLGQEVRVIGQGEDPGVFDYQCPIMSLPLAFGTVLETVPHHVPYLVVPEEARSRWRSVLGAKERPRVGLVWSGSLTHTNDHHRSIPLSAFAPLLEVPVEFHSLQKEVREGDAGLLSGLADHAVALKDFTDTAALVEEMDLIISVDTSVAHIAGALGKPLWLLLPYVPDYRWMLGRADTPWYPSATLYRQAAPYGWPEVLAQVARDVAARFTV